MLDDPPTTLNAIPIAICIVGLIMLVVGLWMIWGPAGVPVVLGGALFAFGLASID